MLASEAGSRVDCMQPPRASADNIADNKTATLRAGMAVFLPLLKLPNPIPVHNRKGPDFARVPAPPDAFARTPVAGMPHFLPRPCGNLARQISSRTPRIAGIH